MPITFGKLCVWAYGRLEYVPEYEQDTRDEIGYYLYDTMEARWFQMFRFTHGLSESDVIPGDFGGMSVKDWVAAIVQADRDKIDELGVDEWWRLELDVDPSVMSAEERRAVLRMEQPPRPAEWRDPWDECQECEYCGERHQLSKHGDSGMVLCENCVVNVNPDAFF